MPERDRIQQASDDSSSDEEITEVANITDRRNQIHVSYVISMNIVIMVVKLLALVSSTRPLYIHLNASIELYISS